MKCLDDLVTLTHHYVRPSKCEACPFFKQDANCYRSIATLEEPVRYLLDDGRVVMVQPDFCTDGASIPQAVWSTVGQPFAGEFLRAALLHDVLYHAGLFDKPTVDRMFHDLLAADGVPWWKRNAMYQAVRFFGGSRFDLAPAITNHFKRFVSVTPHPNP